MIEDLTYAYDKEGNPKQIRSWVDTPPSGQPGPGPGQLRVYEYDGVDRLIEMSGGQTLHDRSTSYVQTFAYDTLHNLTAKLREHSVTQGGNTTYPPETNIDFSYSYNGPRPHAPS